MNTTHPLSTLLEANHEKNKHGCLVTHYSRIPALCLLASTTNGTSGIGRFRGKKVHWWRNADGTWDIEPA